MDQPVHPSLRTTTGTPTNPQQPTATIPNAQTQLTGGSSPGCTLSWSAGWSRSDCSTSPGTPRANLWFDPFPEMARSSGAPAAEPRLLSLTCLVMDLLDRISWN